MEDAPKLLKISQSEWHLIRLHDTNGLNYGPVWKIQSFLLNGICTVILWQDYYGKSNLRRSYWNMAGRKFQIVNVSLYIVKKDYSYLCMRMTYHWLERNKILIRCGNYSTKKSIWGEPTSFWIHVYTWRALKRQCEIRKILWTITGPCSNREFPRWEQKSFHTLKIFVFLHGLMIWRVMQRNVWNDIVSWQTKRLNNSTKYLLHASMTTTSKKKWNLLENCHKYALQMVLKSLYLARISLYLARTGRPDIYGQWTNLHDRLRNWTKACDKRLNRLNSIFITHVNTDNIVMWVILLKSADWDCFNDSDFAGDLEDFWRNIVHFGKSYICSNKLNVQEQTAVSHSSTESEIISLDTGLRLDGLPALELWDLISFLFFEACLRFQIEQGDLLTLMLKRNQKSQGKMNVMENIDSVPSNVQSSRQEALLYVFEDNEAVIKMIIKGRESYNETCFQNSQSCSWLAVRSN